MSRAKWRKPTHLAPDAAVRVPSTLLRRTAVEVMDDTMLERLKVRMPSDRLVLVFVCAGVRVAQDAAIASARILHGSTH